MTADFLFLAVVLLLTFLVSYLHARQLAARGSDHTVHLFLANVIRENNHHLFARVPRLLNESYCGAYPLFLHWILSFLNSSQIGIVAKYLNLSINIAQVLVVYVMILKQDTFLSPLAGWVCLCLALTPQFYHGNSARNYGINSRSVGLLLLTIFYALLLYGVHFGAYGGPLFIGAVVLAYLIWGFNTFAQQSMVLFSVLFGLAWGNWAMIGAAAAGLGVFVFLHPTYAISYLKHTVLFMRTYATDLAKVYVLKDRYSIWRDLVYDLWVRLLRSPAKGMYYGYKNSFLIVLFLNPLIFLAAYLLWSGTATDPLIKVSAQMGVAGLAVFFLTSFRATRFLGEPERYVEAVTVFSTIAGVGFLFSRIGFLGVLAVVIYFAALNGVQFLLAHLLKERMAETFSDLLAIETVLAHEFINEPIRFASNHEVVTKLMMTNPWSFARFWSGEQKFAGFSIAETFSTYPCYQKVPFETAVKQYRINACLLDKSVFDDIFEDGRECRGRLRLLLDTDKYRLYRLEWTDGQYQESLPSKVSLENK